MSRPALFVYVNRDAGTALVRGRDAKAYCKAAEPPAGGRFAWRTVWSGGWTIPASAVEDLRAHARALGQVIAVTEKPPPSRGQSRDTSRVTGTVQEALPL